MLPSINVSNYWAEKVRSEVVSSAPGRYRAAFRGWARSGSYSPFERFRHFFRIRNCGENHLGSENGLKSSRGARVGFGAGLLSGYAMG